MIAALLFLFLAAGEHFDRAMQRLGEGHYAEALALTEQIPDPPLQALARTRCLWAAGDLGGALAAAREGLERDADGDTLRRLLWRATYLSLELGLGDLALSLCDRWENALREATDLSPSERAQWREGWGEGTGLVEARRRAEAARRIARRAERGLARAWGVALGGGGMVLLAMLYLARRSE